MYNSESGRMVHVVTRDKDIRRSVIWDFFKTTIFLHEKIGFTATASQILKYT